MKIIALLFALLVGLFLAFKSTLSQRDLLAQRQQLLANAPAPEMLTQPQSIATML